MSKHQQTRYFPGGSTIILPIVFGRHSYLHSTFDKPWGLLYRPKPPASGPRVICKQVWQVFGVTQLYTYASTPNPASILCRKHFYGSFTSEMLELDWRASGTCRRGFWHDGAFFGVMGDIRFLLER